MRWLLLTTIGVNPGDEFARIGIQRLIEAVDPDASYTLLHKVSNAVSQAVPFDAAVICGMPLFWSLGEHHTYTINWWPHVCGWISEEPRRLLVAGVGSFTPWQKADLQLSDPEGIRAAARRIASRCHRMYFRDPIANQMTGLDCAVHHCPSVFTMLPRQGQPPWVASGQHPRLVNLMADGSHYEVYNPAETAAWREILQAVAAILREAGFTFVAHDEKELELARQLLFPPERIVAYGGDPHLLLEAYAGARQYVGNRVHGAVVCRAAGAATWSIGTDSRQEMVRRTGARVTAPSHLDLQALRTWVAADPRGEPMDLEPDWQAQLAIFREFADGIRPRVGARG